MSHDKDVTQLPSRFKASWRCFAGYHLAQLPVDARLGKLLVMAALMGCLAPALTVAACLSHKSPFSAPVGQQDQARRAMQSLSAAGEPAAAVLLKLTVQMLLHFSLQKPSGADL